MIISEGHILNLHIHQPHKADSSVTKMCILLLNVEVTFAVLVLVLQFSKGVFTLSHVIYTCPIILEVVGIA